MRSLALEFRQPDSWCIPLKILQSRLVFHRETLKNVGRIITAKYKTTVWQGIQLPDGNSQDLIAWSV